MVKMYWIQALTPLHVGSGRGVGFIDLPIIREKATNYPIIPGSAIKGVLRDYFTDLKKIDNNIDDKKIAAVFGKDSEDSSNSGSLMFTDAKIVLLPIKSFRGTFAYVTSPMVLRMLKKLMDAHLGKASQFNIPSPKEEEAFVINNSTIPLDNIAYLEDLDFKAVNNNKDFNEWANRLALWIFKNDQTWQNLFKERFALLHDSAFDYLCEAGTEVNARIRIKDDTKVVEKGHLWYEESLPAETLLAGIASCDRVFGSDVITAQFIIDTFCNDQICCQMGGKATVGKGQVIMKFEDLK